MLQAIKQLFGLGKPAPQALPFSGMPRDLEGEDIPRYPPFAKGLPVAPIGKIMETQRSLIERIRQALGMPQADFDRLVYPVLMRYAAFVHLMPASEAHHHRGAGGLFRHGLEVAFWSSQASGAIMFCMEGSPLERRNNEPRWRLASCFAGLLHDVGKPLSDVMVSDRDGRVTWNPYGESLFDWAGRHKIDRYFLRWRDNRHKRHEKFSLLTVDRLIPQATREYLSDAGPQVIESMLEAISGVGANQPITRLVLRADRESVSRDMKEHRLNVDEFSYGVPVERYIFDALRRLVRSGKWKINVAGGKVWVLQQGVFVIWKPVQDIIDLLAQDKTPGVPRDPDTLADILIERGFAHSCAVSENGEQAQYRYWRVLPDALKEHGIQEHLLMLRLDSVDLIVTGEPPVAVTGDVVGLSLTDDGKDDNGGSDPEAVGAATEASLAATTKADNASPGGVTRPKESAGGAIPQASGADEDEEVDEVAVALEAERAASAALGSLGMDGLAMFSQLEDPGAGAGVDAENSEDDEDDATAPKLPGRLPAAKGQATGGVAIPATALGGADALQQLPAFDVVEQTAALVDLARPGAGHLFPGAQQAQQTQADIQDEPGEGMGMPRQSKPAKPQDAPAPEARPKERKKKPKAVQKGAAVAPETGKAPAKTKAGKPGGQAKKAAPLQPPPLRPGAQPAPPAEDAAPAMAATPAPGANQDADQTLAPEAPAHGKPSPASTTLSAAANDAGRQSSAFLELLALDVGLGAGPQPTMQFIELQAPDEAPVDARSEGQGTPRHKAQTQGGHPAPGPTRPQLPRQARAAPAAPSVREAGLIQAASPAPPLATAPAAAPQSARQALREGLRAYGGQVLQLLGRAIAPLLERKTVLGEALYFEGQRLCILYPDGVKRIAGESGDIQEVISELQQTGAIVPTETIPQRMIWDFDGVKALVLTDAISSLAINAFDEAASGCSVDIGRNEDAQYAEPVQDRSQEYQAPMVDMRRRQRPDNPIEKQADNHELENLPTKQNEPENEPTPEKPGRGISRKSGSSKKIETSADNDDLIARQLHKMIISGEGRWLASAVSQDQHGKHVDVRSLDLIKNDHPALNIVLFKFSASKRGLRIIDKRIYAVV